MDSHITFDGSRFVWTNDTGYADVSDLGIAPGACLTTRAFSVRSRRTGVIKSFALVSTGRDPEGATTYWTFSELPEREDGIRILVIID